MKKEDFRIISHSEKETKEFAQDFAQNLKGGEVLCLYGDLGSGKTTFVKGLAKGLGIKETVVSPTFILHRSYPIPRAKPLKLHHIDLYRIEGLQDVESLGLGEIFADDKSITAIEWAEKIKALLLRKRIDIFFKYLDANKRELTVNHE